MLSTNKILEENDQEEISKNQLSYSRADLRLTREPLATSQRVIYEDDKNGNLDRLAVSISTSKENISSPKSCSPSTSSGDKDIVTLNAEIHTLFDQPLPHKKLDIKNDIFKFKRSFILKNMELIDDLKKLLLSMKLTNLDKFAELKTHFQLLETSSQALCDYAVYASDPREYLTQGKTHSFADIYCDTMYRNINTLLTQLDRNHIDLKQYETVKNKLKNLLAEPSFQPILPIEHRAKPKPKSSLGRWIGK